MKRLLAVTACALALVAVLPLLAMAPALAADTPSAPALSPTQVDIAPLINQVVVPLLGALGGLLVTWLVAKVCGWLGIQANSQVAGVLETAMQNGLAFAQSQLKDKVGNGVVPIDVKNQVIATAANYVIAHTPGAMKTLGVDQASLIQKIEARLSLNTTPAAQSIAVPTDPAGVKSAG